MKINDVMKQTYINNINNQKVNGISPVQAVKKVQGQDQIEVSQASRDIFKYAQLAKTSDVNSSERVNEIKNQLANGTYDISCGKIARGMIDKMK